MKFFILLVTVLVILGTSPYSGHAIHCVRFEDSIRYSIINSTVIVVGEIVETRAYPQNTRERQSVLFVEEVVYGDNQPGDKLVVHWTANKWQEENGKYVEVSQAGTQLDELSGERAIWLLNDEKGVFRSRVILIDAYLREQLEDFIVAVENPDTTNLDVAFLMRFNAELEGNADSLDKCSSFADFIRRELEK